MKLSPKQREALELVADGKFYPDLVKEEDGWHARWRVLDAADEGVEGWVDECVREAAMTRLSEDAEEQRHETLHDAWMMALKSRTGLVVWNEQECAAFAAELKAWSGSAAEDRAARAAITFRLLTPESPPPNGKTAFSICCDVPKGRRMLKALGQATYVWSALCGMRAEPERADDAPTRLVLPLTQTEAADFVRTGARHLRDAGYGVEGVELSEDISASAEIDVANESASAIRRPGEFKLTVRVAGEPVTVEEIRFLLDQGSSLVFFRDRWIEVDRGILKEALRALEKGAGKNANALTFALGLGHIGQLELADVRAHGWLRGLVNELRGSVGLAGDSPDASAATDGSGARAESVRIAGFAGDLRAYQVRGVRWLRFLTDHGFGALLADDMGLGKTIQIIAWLLSVREAHASTEKTARRGTRHTRREVQGAEPENAAAPVLIVAPLTLLSNWRHEFAKFAPQLKVYVHQGDGRHVASGFRRAVAESGVTLTSYGLLVRDYSEFSGVAWNALVLDEAQTIKNPDTQIARAVRALRPVRRIAMTGTPVENSVADIWSLEEFLNPGFLGERKSFTDRFVKPIAADERSAAGRRLRHALEPFVLRRLKTDREIAAELGEKREIREYCELAVEQRRDYEQALADFRATEHTQGDVFSLLTRLKLICDGAGKLDRLCELLEGIFANGESALVFTQYAKVGAWLRTELAARFGRRFPFLHGALSAREREEQIAAFNRRGPGAFLLSLKAGGFGLNLTKATHVIHFDRWWNPAVENQATDRAHRIGQTQTVFVHLFISAGTLEEHVDEILERKARVAGSVITEAEWLEAAKLDE